MLAQLELVASYVSVNWYAEIRDCSRNLFEFAHALTGCPER